MRVGLLGEGTYPVAVGGVSTWYEQLIHQLDEHRFSVVTLVGRPPLVDPEVPDRVDLTFVPMWVPPRRLPLRGRADRVRRVGDLVEAVWAAVLPAAPEAEPDLPALRTALQELATPSGAPLRDVLARGATPKQLVAVWRRHRDARPDLPPLTLADAASVAHLTNPVLGLADQDWPEVDLIHLTANGGAALMALVRHWRDGTPLLLTEHGVYLRERYLALRGEGLSWSARYAVMALIRGLCRLGYAEAARIAPVSDFNGRWAVDLGAPAERVETIHNGVNVERYPVLEGEPDEPVVTWVGRVDPLKDLATLIRAFAQVHDALPAARLRLFGPTPEENADYAAELQRLIAELELADVVSFEGRVDSSVPAFEAGQVVALSSISEGLPFSVIEAMMCGRATVNTEVGGVGEVVGQTGAAGLLVPPRDPAAMAEALLTLLRDAPLRHRTGATARRRAVAHFGLQGCVEQYREAYAAAMQAPVPAAPAEDGSR